MYEQNEVAEWALQNAVNSAHKMMLHQALHWPEFFDMRMWSFVLSHAAYLSNHLPNVHYDLTPLEIFTSTKQDIKVVINEKTWKCPAYMLDPKI